ncbi:hypothetical protein AGMMS50233_10060 [Endomicrobiia bacterium]|nr:hypothetical protein AGMMS50233_10060 [Endomicrobiia bacterium]
MSLFLVNDAFLRQDRASVIKWREAGIRRNEESSAERERRHRERAKTERSEKEKEPRQTKRYIQTVKKE